jgi:hypothetical protein
MGSVKRRQTAKNTLSLVEVCRWELDRLKKVAAEYRAFCSKSRDYLATAGEPHKPVDGGELPKCTDARGFVKMTPGADAQTCRDRAEEHRSFAESVHDPQVKNLLLKIAASYDKIANGHAP